ncbi:unnamed protein product [Mucor hiemalis]
MSNFRQREGQRFLESTNVQMSKKTLSTSAPLETSPLSKRFRIFKRKGDVNQKPRGNRRRSQSFNELSTYALPSPIVGQQQEFRKLKLRITIEEARHLSLEPNNTNTYAIVRCLNQRNRTQVLRRSNNPNWQCTFDIPLFSLLNKRKTKQWHRGVIITVCSKDRFRSQFLGKIQLPLDTAAAESYHDTHNISRWYALTSNNNNRKAYLRRKRHVPESVESLGEIKVKMGLSWTRMNNPIYPKNGLRKCGICCPRVTTEAMITLLHPNTSLPLLQEAHSHCLRDWVLYDFN